MTIVSMKGWLLDRAAEIDQDVAGFCGHVLRASSERRQVIAAYLSVGQRSDMRTTNEDVGTFLMSASHGAALAAAFGSVPPGLRGALRKAGPQPHRRKFYRYLHLLLTAPSRADLTWVITSSEQVNPSTLSILRALPADLRRPSALAAVESVRDARDLSRLLALLSEHGVCRTAMADAFATVATRRGVATFAHRWSMKANLPNHPVPASANYHPVERADQLRRLATRYRNCARNYVPNALEERSAFAEFIYGEAAAIIHLVQEGGRWRLDRCYGRNNLPPRPEVREAARTYLAQFGIEKRRRGIGREAKWAPLRRLAGHHDFEEEQ